MKKICMKADFKSRITFIAKAIQEGKEKAIKVLKVDRKKAKKWWRWYEEKDRTPLVLYQGDGKAIEIKGKPGREGADVENFPLIVRNKQKIMFEGKTYHLSKDGLYRFIVVPHTISNLILTQSASPYVLLRSLALLQVHGNRYNGKRIEELKIALKKEAWLSITCGVISSLAIDILKEQGFKARSVSTLTLDKWNSYSNKHALLETFFPGHGWVLADLDMGLLFRENGRLLSVYKVWKRIKEGRKPEFYHLAQKAYDIDPYFLSATGFNYTIYFKWENGKKDGLWNWHRRIFQTIAIDGIFFGPEKKIKEYDKESVVIPEREWVKRFYG